MAKRTIMARRGQVPLIVGIAAGDLVAHLMKLNSRAHLLMAGHDRFKIIDQIMRYNMGTDVAQYYDAICQEGQSRLRDMIWKRAIILVALEEKEGLDTLASSD